MTCDTTFYKKIEKCLSKDENVWGSYLLSKGTLYRKMTDLQKRQVIRDSLNCARQQWDKWQICRENLDVEEFLIAEAVQIEENDDPLPGFYLNFAEYRKNPPRIRLSNRAIQQTEKVIQDERLGLLLEEVDLRRLILAHELFHHLEAVEPDIYTNHAQIDIKRFGKFRNGVRVRTAGEIAAVHFSKLVSGVSYCPAVMEFLLIRSTDQQRAKRLADQLITEKWG